MVGTMEMRKGCGVVVEESGKWFSFGVQVVDWEGIAYQCGELHQLKTARWAWWFT
jgi:hypothetical protein